MLQDEKKLERLMEIQEEITKLMNQMYKIKEKIYFNFHQMNSNYESLLNKVSKITKELMIKEKK